MQTLYLDQFIRRDQKGSKLALYPQGQNTQSEGDWQIFILIPPIHEPKVQGFCTVKLCAVVSFVLAEKFELKTDLDLFPVNWHAWATIVVCLNPFETSCTALGDMFT
ncbi:hypothetical protein AVEN_111-1 [Araneus ventricosus]|uniref:Uncharacterized protein n=1 Tax=Araneus ventricosus TaxID=182803 RepID=A0A4Y2D333_ARAVE|nr:hypothetical protein AVEN_111-1 [Araneus ventricosus]